MPLKLAREGDEAGLHASPPPAAEPQGTQEKKQRSETATHMKCKKEPSEGVVATGKVPLGKERPSPGRENPSLRDRNMWHQMTTNGTGSTIWRPLSYTARGELTTAPRVFSGTATVPLPAMKDQGEKKLSQAAMKKRQRFNAHVAQASTARFRSLCGAQGSPPHRSHRGATLPGEAVATDRTS